jgi:hypothetical protein
VRELCRSPRKHDPRERTPIVNGSAGSIAGTIITSDLINVHHGSPVRQPHYTQAEIGRNFSRWGVVSGGCRVPKASLRRAIIAGERGKRRRDEGTHRRESRFMAPAEWKKQNVHLSISRISAQKEKVETRLTLLEGILTSDNLKNLLPSDDLDQLLSDDGMEM